MVNEMNNNALNELMQMINTVQNPQMIIQNMIGQNPQLQVIFNQMQQSGMSAEQYVRQFAKQNNVNIEPLINMLGNKK